MFWRHEEWEASQAPAIRKVAASEGEAPGLGHLTLVLGKTATVREAWEGGTTPTVLRHVRHLEPRKKESIFRSRVKKQEPF